MRTPEEIMADVRLESEAIGAALERTRAQGLAVQARLERAHAVWLDTADAGQALETLRLGWLHSQDDLLVVKAAHAGALAYFVRLKDHIKKQIEKGERPPNDAIKTQAEGRP